jgi:hypothetical protein
MAFKIGSTTVIDNSRNHTSGASNGIYAGPNQGFYNGAGTDIAQLVRYTTYTDDLAANCRGYLPNGNCAGNANWNPPNSNWWTWGVGVNCLCTNAVGYDFAGGQTNCNYYGVSINLVYDAYYELYNRIRGSDIHRNYSNCNCVGGSGFGSYNNCNCNCACDCACACACACNC